MTQQRYIKNMDALTSAECKELHSKNVLIAGCGGLGCYVLDSLARIGVLNLTVVDFDKYEESNLNRQLYSDVDHLGQNKVDVAKQRIASVNPDVKLTCITEKIIDKNCVELTKGYDAIVDCLDSYMSRFWLAHGAEKNKTPIIFGAIAGLFGQVSCIYPGDITFVDIYGSMEDGEAASKSEGNLPFTAGLVASIQASQAVGVLLSKDNLLRNKILMIDLISTSFETLQLA